MSPRAWTAAAFRRTVELGLAALLLCACAAPAQALRVVSWNLLQYPQTNLAARQPHFRTVMAGIDADVVIVQELDQQAGRDSFLTNVLNVVQPGQWTGTPFLQLGTEGGAVFWKPAKVAVSNLSSVATGGPRPVLVCLVKPVGYLTNASWFRLYSVHFKAGNPSSSPSDSMTRHSECTNLRIALNNTVTGVVGPNFLLGGDTNFYGAWENGYLRLTEVQLNNTGRGFDPYSMPGTWNSNPTYASTFTQCPCLSGCGPGFSGGGLDDRFDLFVTSSTLQDGAGLDLVPGGLPNGYGAYGNDGQHFNIDVNGNGFNAAVGLTIANALHEASDHMPVIANLQLPARVVAASALDFGSVIVGAAASQSLLVSNGAPVPGAVLSYSFVAPAGFSAPAGTFTANAGAAANVHAIDMSTGASGDRSGTLAISTNAPDTLTKNVLLSGRVLDHASPSLDSTTVTLVATLDFGDHAPADFTDQTVRVHDFGWNALRARLALNAANLTGDSHFSIAGGFTPSLIAGVGRSIAVHFDTTGTAADSTYLATLTFVSADEPLPGATAAPDLVVHLRARRIANTNATPPGGVTALRFYAPRPNPLTRGTELAFDLPRAAPVALAIYDLGGRRVAELAGGELGPGHHALRWNAQDEGGQRAPAGLYFARFSTPGLTRIERLILLP